MTRAPRLVFAGVARRAALRAALLSAVLAASCGLVNQPEPIGFNSYPLQDCSYDTAVEIVREVTRKFATERFGGIGMTWDPVDHNLVLDPVYDGQRRMRLYIHLEPEGADVNVEMFALVETLHSDAGAVGWSDPQQDVPLEEQLYQAYIAALVARRGGAP